MARTNSAQALHRNTLADGSDLKPIGPPPKTAPDRVRAWWRKTVRDWPQLSRRDYQAFLDYCFLLVEQEDLRALVTEHGMFWEVVDVKGPKDNRVEVRRTEETPYYAALVRAERRLMAIRRDFAALAGYRERAGAVPKPKAKAVDPVDEV